MHKIKMILILVMMFFSIGKSAVVIKLGSYSHRGNLAKQITLLRDDISSNTHIIEENDMFKGYSNEFDTREEASAQLHLYQEIFTDAYIMQSTNIDKNSNIKSIKPIKQIKEIEEVKKEPQKKQNPLDYRYKDRIEITPSDEVMTPVSYSNGVSSLGDIIKGNTFYICPHKINSNGDKLLIEAKFSQETQVTYKTIVGKVPSLSMAYIVHKERLYFTRSQRVNPYQYSQLDDRLFDYYVISKWSRGKKISKMRYYKKLENAKSYLDSLHF